MKRAAASVQSGQIAGRVVVVRHADAPRYASAIDAARACVWALGATTRNAECREPGASVQSGQMEGKR